jgi:hypothetical protein
MYVSSIVWLATFPLLIFVSYMLVRAAIRRFEKNEENK